MSARWLLWLFPSTGIVDQVHEPAALVELADGALVAAPRRCLPPDPREGERLRYRPRRAAWPCPARFVRPHATPPASPPTRRSP